MTILILSILLIIILAIAVYFIIRKKKEKIPESIKPETPTKPSINNKSEEPKEINQTIEASEPFVQENLIKPFKEIIDIKEDSETYKYLSKLYFEAIAQYGNNTYYGLPLLYKEENFPQIYNFYGDKGDEYSTFKTLVGWLFAMQLAELRPQDRTALYKIGYEMGGYDKDSALYGWRFRCDPNISRLVAAAIYSAMRGIIKPNIKAMREECGGVLGSREFDLKYIKDYENSFSVKDTDFYVDLRKFMPTAPGPYTPNYEDRSLIGGYPYPNDEKTKDYNLSIDKAIRDYIIENYNLDNSGYYALDKYEERAVQAIADKDAHYNHLFGKRREVEQYWFNPVFTFDILGKEVYPSLTKDLCDLVNDVLYIGSYQRCILQGHEKQMHPYQYGRLRPGCSWIKEVHRHSDTNDEENVLTNFDIEENDGNPTGHYNKDGEWVKRSDIHSPEEYNDKMKDELWANSYPSGHSAGIMSVVLTLIELLPNRADKILKAGNMFAVNRTIARYHWNSDTIQGRVLATCIAPIIRCCSDWNKRFNLSKNCLNNE